MYPLLFTLLSGLPTVVPPRRDEGGEYGQWYGYRMKMLRNATRRFKPTTQQRRQYEKFER